MRASIRVSRPNVRLLLASSSVAALLVGGGAPSAFATPNCNIIQNGGTVAAVTNSSPTGNCIYVENGANVTGNVTNTGTGILTPTGTAYPSANGITIDNSTIGGAIVNQGVITSTVEATTVNGIVVTNGATVAGGITNSGTIALAAELADRSEGISVSNVAAFTGDISNTNLISIAGNVVSAIGINVSDVTTFTGRITNSGTITVANEYPDYSIGINVENVMAFTGGIANSKTINATTENGCAYGIDVSYVNTFMGGVSNGGTITATATGDGSATGINVSNVTMFTGGITNSGTISAAAQCCASAIGINVSGVASFNNGISNGGTIVASVSEFSGTAIGINVSNVTTFSGGITNSGKITAAVECCGKAIGINVSSVSTFSGGITNSGTISASGGISAAPIGINVDDVTTFIGSITNNRQISVTVTSGGSATGINVANVQNFMGGITNGGTIAAIGASGEVLSFGIKVNNVTVFTGDINNSGTIIVNVPGGGIATGIQVSGVSTFTGGITNTGTITGSCAPYTCSIYGIVVTDSAPVRVFDSGVIDGTGGTAVDLSGNAPGNTFTLGPGYSIVGKVLGTGSDTFQLGGTGTGTFDLSTIGTTQQYEGFTAFNVISGTWITSNTFGQSQAWNVNGGTLAGTGVFQSVNINNGGTLEPGTPSVAGGKLTINGNLVFANGANYVVNIAPGASSITVVSGKATLAGIMTINATGGTYVVGTVYDVLSAGGGLNGTFSTVNVTGSFGALKPVVTYDDVYVTLEPAGLTLPPGATINETDAGTAISNANNGSLPKGFQNLFDLSPTQLSGALTQLDGEAATDAERGAFLMMDQFLELMLDPFVDGRSGAGWPISGGMATASNFAPDERASLPPDVALAYASVLKAPPRPTFDQRWTTWAAGFGASNTSNGDPVVVGSTNVTASDYGYAAGMDYHFSPDSVAGFAFAGGGTNWGLEQGLGGGRSDDFQAGVYGVTRSGPLYVAGALAFANHWLSTSRFALGDDLTANFTAQSYGARVEGGYRYATTLNNVPFGVTPYAALRVQTFDAPSYSETDVSGGGFALSYAAMNTTDTRSELGARFDSPTMLGSMPLMLRGRLAWAHDWVSNPSLTAAFEALPGSSFIVYGAPFAKDSALTTFGAVLHINANWSFAAKFDGEFASGSQTYAGTGTLRYTW